MFEEENIITINKLFSNGNIKNHSSLSFALSSINSKGSLEQLAYLVRAIVVDHAFEDGNKRTAAAIITAYYAEFEIGFDEDKVVRLVKDIASKNITNISKIKRMIQNVVR